MYGVLDFNQPINQAGFRRGFSTADHILALNLLIEKAREYNFELHLMFIDYKKAFDSVYHSTVWKALHQQGVEQEVLKVLKHLYYNSVAYIKLDTKGTCFQLGRGVKQGDPLSPNLFNSVLENIFRELNWEGKGIKINGMWLNNLRFADDVVLISRNMDELRDMASELYEASKKAGLFINVDKTKILSENTGGVVLGNHEIQVVNEYKYLGQIISLKNRMEKEINARRANAWKNFWMHKHILKSNMKTPVKIRMLESCIVPTLLYGAQTWALTNRQAKKLETTFNSMLRSILNIKQRDKISMARIRSKTKTKKISAQALGLKLRYAGHLIRGVDKWTKKLVEWTPRDLTRREGRPPTRWGDLLTKNFGTLWPRTALDRQSWKRAVDAYARRWADRVG